MQAVTKKSKFSQFLTVFSQRTSIRGVSKLENTVYTSIKLFWGFFIVTAHVVMITVVALLVHRFLQYDQVIKTTSRRIELEDFPEVTVCSKQFFQTFYYNREVIALLEAYRKEIISKYTVLRNKEDWGAAYDTLYNEFTTFSFVSKHIPILQNRTNLLAIQYTDKCSIEVLQNNFTFSKIGKCHTRGVINPLYLDCLAFSVPKGKNLASAVDMVMKIDLETDYKSDSEALEKFKMDEIYSFNTYGGSYKAIFVYINPVSDYPFDVNYEVPFTCRHENDYHIELFKETKSENLLQRGTRSCTNEAFKFDSFGVSYSATQEHVCRSLKTQEKAIRMCGCFIPFLPMQGLLEPPIVSCFENSTLRDCYMKVANLGHGSDFSSCLPPCTKTHYSIKHTSKPLHVSLLSQTIQFYRSASISCVDVCVEMHECLTNSIFELYKSYTCDNPYKVKISETDCREVKLSIHMKPMVTVKTESLVVEISTLLSQISGVCAFFTGLTFTFIAELVEAIIIWRASSS